MVEFALVAPLFLLLVMGIVEYSAYFSDQDGVSNAASTGARYAATHPSAWSTVAQAPAASIEGSVQSVAYPSIPNTDANIAISYYNISGATAVECGKYASGAFVPLNSYTQATCLVPLQTMIQIDVTYTHVPLTPYPVPASKNTFTETTRVLEEQ